MAAIWANARQVPVISAITRARFEEEVVPAHQPVVLKGLVADWTLVEKGRQSRQALAQELKAHATNEGMQAWFAAPELRGRFGYSENMAGFNHERRVVTLAELIDYLVTHGDDPAAYTAYAGGIPVPKAVPGLLPQVPMPLLETGREMLVSLWLGGRSRTAAHWDLPQNLACVVAGRRRFTLFPTDQISNLYVGPLDFTLAGQPASLVDIVNPDLERFPKFRAAMNAAWAADMEPGDAVYIPSLWWHHVESRDTIRRDDQLLVARRSGLADDAAIHSLSFAAYASRPPGSGSAQRGKFFSTTTSSRPATIRGNICHHRQGGCSES